MRYSKGIFTTLLSSLLLFGCAQVELDQDSVSQHLLGYDVIENKPSTKAIFPTDNTFMSAAYKLTSGKTWDANQADAFQYFNSSQEEVKFQGTYWKTDYDYYWPDDGGSLTFFSYSPKSVGATISKNGVSVSNWNVLTRAGEVILVADIAKDRKKNEGYAGFSGVPTLFRHKLSKFSFKVAKSEYAEDDIDVRIKSIKIVDIYLQGNYSRGGYNNDTWTGLTALRTSANPVVVYSAIGQGDLLSVTPQQAGDDQIMIPQMLSRNGSVHPRIIVEYSTTVGSTVEDKSVECFFAENFRSGEWAKGQHVTYTIDIGVGQYPIEFSGSVSDWTWSNSGEVTVQ